MAVYSVGVSVQFAGRVISEVTGLSWSGKSGLSLGRSEQWTSDAGTVEVNYLEPASIPSELWNTRGNLLISGGGMDLSVTAVCGQVQRSATLNGVTNCSLTFQILE